MCPKLGSTIATSADQEPAPTPATRPACCFGNAIALVRNETTTNPEAINIAQNMSASTTADFVNSGPAMGGKPSMARLNKIHDGLALPAAKRSVNQPQKKYPISQPSGGSQSTRPSSPCVKAKTFDKYSGAR